MQFSQAKPHYLLLLTVYTFFIACFLMRIIYNHLVFEQNPMEQKYFHRNDYTEEFYDTPLFRRIFSTIMMAIEFTIVSFFFLLEVKSEAQYEGDMLKCKLKGYFKDS